MRWCFLGLILVMSAGCSGKDVESKTMPPQENMVMDRVCINEKAIAFAIPSHNTNRSCLPFHFWDMACWLETAENGMEQIQMADGKKWWVESADFVPVYRVSTEDGADLLVNYITETFNKKTPGPHGIRSVGHFDKGELLGVRGVDSQLSGSYTKVSRNPDTDEFDTFKQVPVSNLAFVISGDHRMGCVETKRIEPVGNPGPH